MLKININVRYLYYGWLIFNFVLLILSGYFSTLATAFLKNSWAHFLEIHTMIYPFDTDSLGSYDIMEFCLYTGIPLLAVRIINKLKPSPRRSSYTVASLRKRI